MCFDSPGALSSIFSILCCLLSSLTWALRQGLNELDSYFPASPYLSSFFSCVFPAFSRYRGRRGYPTTVYLSVPTFPLPYSPLILSPLLCSFTLRGREVRRDTVPSLFFSNHLFSVLPSPFSSSQSFLWSFQCLRSFLSFLCFWRHIPSVRIPPLLRSISRSKVDSWAFVTLVLPSFTLPHPPLSLFLTISLVYGKGFGPNY